MNNDDLVKQIRNVVHEEVKAEIEPVKKDLQDVKRSQAQTNTTAGQMKTAVDALAAGQAEITGTMATKADIQDLKATVMKKVNDYEERITDLEKAAGIPHPHKH